ncbi:MAG TPA: HAD-IC family P-type ATPase, partial [Rubrobacteraceae bacterium]|nr:HAD-IC family P-type ATPase [Rubrobacteraceae bacterium]
MRRTTGRNGEENPAEDRGTPKPRPFDPEERIDLLLGHLGTRRDGLPEREAARRLEQHGPNEIRRREGNNHLRELARQFTHPLALLLWVAALLAFAGGTTPLAVAIVAVIVLNALFAFVQELQAEKATEALKRYLPPKARVRRGGQVLEVEAVTLVPGDLLLLSEGDRLSADARLIGGSVEVDMAPLTGESQPVARSAARTRPAPSAVESEDLVFSGTLVTAGEAEAIVYATGMGTQLGRIAALTQRVTSGDSPLQAQVNRAAKLIAAVAVGAGVLFLAVGTTFAHLPLADAVTFAIGLLVANVPEGLLPTITLALAVGVRRMARRKALLKRLAAVETLGSTDVICTDKTGTLTEGRMTVSRFWAGGVELDPSRGAPDGTSLEPFSGLLRTAVRCSNAGLRPTSNGWEHSGDPSESALLEAAAALGEDVRTAQEEREQRRRRLYHFDARIKRMTTADEEPDGRLWYHAKGAPLELLEHCAYVRGPEGDGPLDDAGRKGIRLA